MAVVTAVGGLAGLLAAARTCHYAGQRDWCQRTAVLTRGSVPLCRACADRVSSLSRLQQRPLPSTGQESAPAPSPLPPGPVPPVVTATPWPRRRQRTPLEELASLARARQSWERRARTAVVAARRSGATWQEIADGLGEPLATVHRAYRS